MDVVNLPPGSSIAPSSVEPGTPAEDDEAEQCSVRQDRPVGTASTGTRGTYSVQSPAKPPESSTPYDAATSVMAQASEKAAGSPLALYTPLPAAQTPEVWPVVDEREYMNSPERSNERLSTKQIDMILAPVAPPPSPEPAGMDVDYDIQEMSSKSTATPSLTPLAEEEEEEEEEEDVSVAPEVMALHHRPDQSLDALMGDNVEEKGGSTGTRGTEAERIGTSSGGYLGDDEGAENSTPGESGAGQTDQGTINDSVPDEQAPQSLNQETEGLETIDSTVGKNTLAPLTEDEETEVVETNDSTFRKDMLASLAEDEETEGLETVDSTVRKDTLAPLTEGVEEDVPVASDNNQVEQPVSESTEQNNEVT